MRGLSAGPDENNLLRHHPDFVLTAPVITKEPFRMLRYIPSYSLYLRFGIPRPRPPHNPGLWKPAPFKQASPFPSVFPDHGSLRSPLCNGTTADELSATNLGLGLSASSTSSMPFRA